MKREVIHSMLRRCANWDYSASAMYMITLVLADRKSKALGEVVVDSLSNAIAENRTLSAHCELFDLGKSVADCWEAIPKFYPQIQIVAKQVMPDHFHGILWVKEPLPCHLGQVIKGFKIGCNKAYRQLNPEYGSSVLGDSIAKEKVSGLFSSGFQDTIIFREGQLARMIKYIRQNPLRLAIKRSVPDFFKVINDLEVPVMLSQGTGLGSSAHESSVLGSSVLGDSIAENHIAHFSSIGNRFLLDCPLIQIQCSRSFFGYKREPMPGDPRKTRICRDERGEPIVAFATKEYEEKRDALFAAAKHGAELLSPCISDGEKQLAHEALDAKLRLVVMRNKGFSPLAKPPGKYFEACSDGRLLMLAPAAWPYVPGEKQITRSDALAMNRLCQWLAGDGAAEINYHGALPADIEAAAKAAASVVACGTNETGTIF